MTLLEQLDRCPPFLVYYASHLVRGERLSVPQLVQAFGLSDRTFTRLAHRHTWAGVKVGVADRFCRACGVDIMQPDALLASLAKEMSLPPEERFKGLEGNHRCREKMIARLNGLAARAAIAKAQMPQPKH